MLVQHRKNIILGSLFCFLTALLGICYASTSDVIEVEATTNILAHEGLFITDIALASGSSGAVEENGISGTFTNNTITLGPLASDTTTINYTIYNNSGSTVYFHDVVYMMQEEIESQGLSGFVFYDNPNIILDKNSFASMIGTALAQGQSITIPVTYKYASSDTSNNILNLSLSFNFTLHCYEIDFDENISLDVGETLSNFPSKEFYWGEGNLTFPSASASNHVFLGWSENKDATEPDYLPNDTVSNISTNMTYYAIWAQYKIIYNDNYGTAGPGEINYGANKNVNISNIVPSRDYFTFDGWAISESSLASYQPNDAFTFEDGGFIVTLYAQWSPMAGIYSVTITGLPDTPSGSELMAYENQPYSIDVHNSDFYPVITMSGVRFYDFTYTGTTITIPNVTGDISISLNTVTDVDIVIDDNNPNYVVAEVTPSNPIQNTTALTSYKFKGKTFSEKTIKQINVEVIYTNKTGSTVNHPFTLAYNNQTITQDAVFNGKTTNGTAIASFTIVSPGLSFSDSFSITNATGSGTGNITISGLSFHVVFAE